MPALARAGGEEGAGGARDARLATPAAHSHALDADVPRERVIRSAVAVVAGVALTVAGLLLERACKVPRTDDDEDDGLA